MCPQHMSRVTSREQAATLGGLKGSTEVLEISMAPGIMKEEGGGKVSQHVCDTSNSFLHPAKPHNKPFTCIGSFMGAMPAMLEERDGGGAYIMLQTCLL